MDNASAIAGVAPNSQMIAHRHQSRWPWSACRLSTIAEGIDAGGCSVDARRHQHKR